MTRCMWCGVVVLLQLLLHCELLVVDSLNDEQLSELWIKFKLTHNKQYASQKHEDYRRGVFASNMHFINEHNLLADLGQYSFTLGINEYSDLTTQERSRFLTGYVGRSDTDRLSVQHFKFDSDPPDFIDWREMGAVTPIRNQGMCLSCWAFAAVGALEAMNFKKTGRLVPLSEQDLIDCDTLDGGCRGGLPRHAYAYLAKSDGIDTRESYPYTAKDCKVCRFNRSTVGTTISDYIQVRPGDENELKATVGHFGPCSVAISTPQSFMEYKYGIYNDPLCNRDKIGHGVLLVGYGQMDTGEKYWIIKNSWGTSWGMNGYMFLARDEDDMCHIASDANVPLP